MFYSEKKEEVRVLFNSYSYLDKKNWYFSDAKTREQPELCKLIEFEFEAAVRQNTWEMIVLQS